jgi:hypothetical protein
MHEIYNAITDRSQAIDLKPEKVIGHSSSSVVYLLEDGSYADAMIGSIIPEVSVARRYQCFSKGMTPYDMTEEGISKQLMDGSIKTLEAVKAGKARIYKI